jgi:hypothetical protein
LVCRYAGGWLSEGRRNQVIDGARYPLFHGKLPASERWRRQLIYQRWITAIESQIGHKLPRRGPFRPDVAARNWWRWRDPADVEDRWRAFRSRSDARAKAWQEKHQRARERAASVNS